MHRIPSLLVPFAVSLCAACAAPRGAPELDLVPLEPRGAFPVEYSARLSSVGLARDVAVDPQARERMRRAAARRPRVSQVEVSCRILELDRTTALAVVDTDAGWLRASLVERAAARSAFDELGRAAGASLLAAPAILLCDGTSGTITLVDDRAFVESFGMQATGEALAGFIADPVVAVARSGLMLEVAVERAGDGRTELDLTLRTAELQEPLQEASGTLPGTADAVTLQIPIFSSQTVGTRALVGAGEALLIGPIPARAPGRALLLLVTARRLGTPLDLRLVRADALRRSRAGSERRAQALAVQGAGSESQ